MAPPPPPPPSRPPVVAPPPQTFPYDHLFKLLIIGDAGVGKSSMLLRFTDDSFDDHIQSTIGVDFKVKHIEWNGKRVKLTIWDTAGQERFRTLTSSYYRGAHGVVLVYDVQRMDSFEHLQQWLQEVMLYTPHRGEHVVKLLVGNKIDLERRVPRAMAEDWARSQGMLFLEASAKTKLGIRQVFLEVVQKILEDPDVLATTLPGRPPGSSTSGSGSYGNSGSASGGHVQLRPQYHTHSKLNHDDDESGCC